MNITFELAGISDLLFTVGLVLILGEIRRWIKLFFETSQ